MKPMESGEIASLSDNIESDIEDTLKLQRPKTNQTKGVRERMNNGSIKAKIKILKKIIREFEAKAQNKRQVKKQDSTILVDTVNNSFSETSSDDEIVFDSEFIKVLDKTVILTSPTFGDQIKITNPKCKIGSYKSGLKDLKHIEQQIQAMGILPDFGYQEDNYILDHQNDQENKWKLLTGLLGDTKKFQWLMQYISLQHLQESVRKNEEQEHLKRQARAQQRAQKRQQLGNQVESQEPKDIRVIIGQKEMQAVLAVQNQARNTLLRFKRYLKSQSEVQTSPQTVLKKKNIKNLTAATNKSQLVTQDQSPEPVKKRQKLIQDLDAVQFKITAQLTRTFTEIRKTINLDHNLPLLPKLKAAKTATVTLLRACRKNNFNLLVGDDCLELELIAQAQPEILKWEPYIRHKRFKHKSMYENCKTNQLLQTKLPTLYQYFTSPSLVEDSACRVSERYNSRMLKQKNHLETSRLQTTQDSQYNSTQKKSPRNQVASYRSRDKTSTMSAFQLSNLMLNSRKSGLLTHNQVAEILNQTPKYTPRTAAASHLPNIK